MVSPMAARRQRVAVAMLTSGSVFAEYAKAGAGLLGSDARDATCFGRELFWAWAVGGWQATCMHTLAVHSCPPGDRGCV